MSLIINENKIQSILAASSFEDPVRVREVLAKALEFKGLNLEDAAQLMAVKDERLLEEVFTAANKVKEEIYGRRIVIFAPLYISNFCTNECLYCAFRTQNKSLKRKRLSIDEVAKETLNIIQEGQKRIVLLTGEINTPESFDYVISAMQKIYETKDKNGSIRRINVEIAPLTVPEFKRLKEAKVGTYLVFQETYHRDTYAQVHLGGKKTDYDWRISVFDRALSAGVDDVGMGVLFGLYDWHFEVLALLQHANYLQDHFGVGPHTISVPRLEPALGSEIANKPLAEVSDIDFCKIVAILRLAVPYTGIIMSTRENQEIRRKTLELGVSQISAGSRTNPGGYSNKNLTDDSQFSLGDHRSLDEVVRDVANLGYLPSFCTACYRLGRTGEDFMCLAKHGKIKKVCAPNAIATFAEYLSDYASSATKEIGQQLIQNELKRMSSEARGLTEKLLARVRGGERDIFV